MAADERRLLGREGRVESRDDLRNVRAVEFLDGGVKLAAFLALYEELGNLLAPPEVLWADLSDLAPRPLGRRRNEYRGNLRL